jgi:hypothetical protein
MLKGECKKRKGLKGECNKTNKKAQGGRQE